MFLLRYLYCVPVVVMAAATGANALAQSTHYPIRPLRFIVPYAAGGNGDIVSRIIAHKLVTQLGQQIVIDNRGGAGGNIGAELAARVAPDGYTIMLGTNTHAIIMRLNREITGALGSSDVKDQLRVQGVDTQPSTPEQFAVFIRAEIAKWAKVIKTSGAKVD